MNSVAARKNTLPILLQAGMAWVLFAWNVALAQEASQPSREFARLLAPRVWQFPRDHGKHEEFQTEWWYYTGNLRSAEGRRFGYQLTFFRNALLVAPPARQSQWAFREGYVVHFSITDIERQDFFYEQRMSRGALELAGAAQESLAVHVGAWSARGGNSLMRLQAESEFGSIDLRLEETRAPMFHGKNGMLQKGSQADEASYYYSLPHLRTNGRLLLGADTFAVEGTSWMDHEFFSSVKQSEVAGWDWFSLHLSDSSAIMLYLLRDANGKISRFSGGTLLQGSDSPKSLSFDAIEASPQSWWRSAATGGRYPVAWRLKIAGYELHVSTPVENQELDTRKTTGVIYWEGYIEVSGKVKGAPLRGMGYLEMTGYAQTVDLSQKN